MVFHTSARYQHVPASLAAETTWLCMHGSSAGVCARITSAMPHASGPELDLPLLDLQAILQWFESRGARSPTTGRPLPDTRLVPNNALRSIIQAFSEE